MRRFGRTRSDQVPRAFVQALERVLEPLPGSGDLVGYVLTGSPGGALATLAGSRYGAARYDLLSPDRRGSRERLSALYAQVADVDAPVLRRYAEVLDAAWGRGTWGLTMGTLNGARWPELMLMQARSASVPEVPLPLSFADLVRVAAEDGAGPADLVRATFEIAPYARFTSGTTTDTLSRLPGYAQAVADHAAVVTAALTTASVEERVGATQILDRVLDDGELGAFAEVLAEAATTTSAQVRSAAGPALARAAAAAVAPLRRLAVEAKPEQRGHAVDLLAAMPDQREWALETARSDRAPTVRAVAARWDAASTSPPDDDLVLPTPAPLPSWQLPRDEAAQVARSVTEALAEAVHRHNEQTRRFRQSHPTPPGMREPTAFTPPSASETKALAALLASDRPPSVSAEPAVVSPGGYLTRGVFELVRDQLDVTTGIAVLTALHLLVHGPRLHPQAESALEGAHARTGGPDLLTLQRMLDHVGTDGRALIWASYSSGYGARLGRTWPDEQVWPFVATHLDWVLERPAIASRWNIDEHALFAALATLPRPPARVVDHLYAVAVGQKKADRAPAQAALAHDPHRATRAAAALDDGRSETRQAAAQWLARIADPAVLPQLQAAWQRERQDVVRGALLDALVAVGEDPETYLDPETTAAAAERFVAKGMPAALAWLDWSTVPDVTWASSGETVPRVIVQWMCATAVKARSPEPNAVLRHQARLLAEEDRQQLAVHLLAGWIAEDLAPISAAEAEQQAAAHAQGNHRWLTLSPDSRYYGMSVEELTAALLPTYARRPAGSAAASKGLLAVVAACGGADVVAPTERYLREWYGQRASQGKALITMLAWVDDPAAVQLVLAVGSRFRTKSFQDEAVRQAQALADRNGWTVDELADRTIPTAGFDERGLLDLPYGDRVFTAQLKPDLTVELRDPTGKVIASLPAARASDDAEQAKDSKKAFSNLKKQLKAIASLQTDRLYEAMCTQRSWPADDWSRYLCRHPVVGPAVRRLVWVATADSEPTAGDGRVVFRPLDDGTLTDVDDTEVALPEGARVALAHDSVLTPEEARAWAEHLADYEVVPLFQQLGRGVHAVTPQLHTGTELTDVRGHVLMTFSLRGKALKLGWTRGPAEDGGVFTTYTKRFATLGITAVLDFTGNALPEENRLVALTGLRFVRQPAEGQEVPLTLGEVPAVLLSECWQDVQLIAAEGTGFDPDWEKKAHY